MTDSAPSIAEVTAALTAPGRLFEMEEVVTRGLPTRTWKNAPPSLRAVLEGSRSSGPRRRWPIGWSRTTTSGLGPGRHRHAQLPGVVRCVLGRRVGERGGRAAERLVDGTGARVRPGRLGFGGALLRRRAGRAAGGPLPGLDALRATIVAKAEPGTTLPAAAVTFEEAIGAIDTEAELPDVAIEPEDDATIFYTSGTTGRPKGALGTQRNICTKPAVARLRAGQGRRPRPSRRCPGPAPLGPNTCCRCRSPRHGLKRELKADLLGRGRSAPPG